MYLPIVTLRAPTFRRHPSFARDYTSHKGRLKGVIENDKLIFRYDENVVNVTRRQIIKEVTETWDDEDEYSRVEIDKDTVISHQEVKLWSANHFSKVKTTGRDDDYSWSREVEFYMSYNDVIGDIDKDTYSIYNLNSGLLISTTPRISISAGQDSFGSYEPYLTQVFQGFIAGQISDTAPLSLPRPELKVAVTINSGYQRGGLYWESGYYNLDVKLCLVNCDGKLLDPEKTFIRVWVDDEQLEDKVFSSYGNPYSKPLLYKITLNSYDYASWDHDKPSFDNYHPSVKVMCYFRNDDGTVVESPYAYINYPDGIEEIESDIKSRNVPSGDDRIYDLTGREVSKDNLSPGIYICNGRKFVVSGR